VSLAGSYTSDGSFPTADDRVEPEVGLGQQIRDAAGRDEHLRAACIAERVRRRRP
jgi:hypothetical protein